MEERLGKVIETVGTPNRNSRSLFESCVKAVWERVASYAKSVCGRAAR